MDLKLPDTALLYDQITEYLQNLSWFLIFRAEPDFYSTFLLVFEYKTYRVAGLVQLF